MRFNFFLIGLASAGVLISACAAQVPGAPSPLRAETEGKSPTTDTSLDLPPLPKREVSLIGGAVIKVDPIRDRLVVRAFGGRDVTLDFDVRTEMLRGTTPASVHDLRPGTRIYADTILKDGRIFAKTVRIDATGMPGETKGQVIGYDTSRQILKVRDIISSQPFAVRLTSTTELRCGGQPAPASDLVSGALVDVVFRSASDGTSSAQKIEILARPGSTFTFAGKITVVDLRDRHLTLAEPDSDNTFEVGLDSLSPDARLRLKQGTDVIVRARFDGRKYQAQSVEPTSAFRP